MKVLLIGPAGSGKSLLTGRFGEWLRRKGNSVALVNLDPACEYLPYKPDFDIRSFYNIKKIMRKEKLGPNAAIIRVHELLSNNLEKILSKLKIERDFILVDTSGQMELFVFRETGPKIVEALKDAVGIFLVDATLMSPIDLVTIKLMAQVVRLRLNVPVVPVITKVDLVPKINFADSARLTREIRKQKGSVVDLALALNKSLEEFAMPVRVIKISSKTCEGFEELLSTLYETYCECGDLT